MKISFYFSPKNININENYAYIKIYESILFKLFNE